jgi:hypothetical protein
VEIAIVVIVIIIIIIITTSVALHLLLLPLLHLQEVIALTTRKTKEGAEKTLLALNVIAPLACM